MYTEYIHTLYIKPQAHIFYQLAIATEKIVHKNKSKA